MKFLRRFQGGIVALTFFGEYMQHHRVLAFLGVFQRLDHQRQIMAIQRTDITNAQLLKQHTTRRATAAVGQYRGFMRQCTLRHLRLECAFRPRPEPNCKIALGQFLNQIRQIIMQPVVARVGDDLVQVLGNGSDVFINAPFIVIENANEFLSCVRNIVQRLK